MSFQRLYLPVGLSARTYQIPRFAITIPFWPPQVLCSGWTGKPVSISWDSTKTTILSSRLFVKAHSNGDPIDFKVNFNGVEVKHFTWGEGTKCTEKSDVIDIQIIEGLNELEVRACKQYPWLAAVTVSVEAYVEVTFEGEAPQRPWWEVFQEWLAANWPYLAIGTGLMIVAGVTYIYLESPRSS